MELIWGPVYYTNYADILLFVGKLVRNIHVCVAVGHVVQNFLKPNKADNFRTYVCVKYGNGQLILREFARNC